MLLASLCGRVVGHDTSDEIPVFVSSKFLSCSFCKVQICGHQGAVRQSISVNGNNRQNDQVAAFGQGPIFRLAVIVVNSFLSCVRTNKKKADSPESESAFNVRDCELYERKTRLVDDIYRTTKSLCRSQAASTKKQSPPTDTVNGRKS